jgi:hypothetical protein
MALFAGPTKGPLTHKLLQYFRLAVLSKIRITMSDQTRALLQSWLRRPTKPAGLVRRARALLLLEQEQRFAPTARQVGLSERPRSPRGPNAFVSLVWQAYVNRHAQAVLLCFLLKSLSLSSSSPVNDQINSDVPCRSGTVPISLVSGKMMASCLPFLLRPSAGFCRPISSGPGALTGGSRHRSPVITSSLSRFSFC